MPEGDYVFLTGDEIEKALGITAFDKWMFERDFNRRTGKTSNNG